FSRDWSSDVCSSDLDPSAMATGKLGLHKAPAKSGGNSRLAWAPAVNTLGGSSRRGQRLMQASFPNLCGYQRPPGHLANERAGSIPGLALSTLRTAQGLKRAAKPSTD